MMPSRRAAPRQINLNSAKEIRYREGARERRFYLCRFDHNKTIHSQTDRADDADLFTLRRR